MLLVLLGSSTRAQEREALTKTCLYGESGEELLRGWGCQSESKDREGRW